MPATRSRGLTPWALPLQHYYPFSFPAFAAEDSLLAAAGHDGKTIYFVDGGQQAPRSSGSQGHQGGVEAVAFAPNGKTLASASRDTTSPTLRNHIRAGYRTSSGALRPGPCVRWPLLPSGGSPLASSGDDDTVPPLGCGERPATSPVPGPLRGRSEPGRGMVFAPDGQTLVAEGGTARSFRLWDVATGEEVRTLSIGSISNVSAGSPLPRDGQTLASTDTGRVRGVRGVHRAETESHLACPEKVPSLFPADGEALL